MVVEWRALTVALLDELAPLVREHAAAWTPSECRWPACSRAAPGRPGRALAERLRDGCRRLHVVSDGTVF